MRRLKAKDINCGDTIIAKSKQNKDEVYGYLANPFKVDSIFMNNRINNLYPSDGIIRFNGNGRINESFPTMGLFSSQENTYWFVS